VGGVSLGVFFWKVTKQNKKTLFFPGSICFFTALLKGLSEQNKASIMGVG
jgi:hypothetical protein